LAALHALHAPAQAVSQQKPSAQLPLVHWPAELHAVPSANVGLHALAVVSHHAPVPQSVSAPQGLHVPVPSQKPLAQSALAAHFRSLAHAGHAPPPQSTSVSLPFVDLSVHVAGTHAPDAQTLCGEPAQSASALHSTHVPFPSQSLPPFSAQLVPAPAGSVPHWPAVHVAVTQAELGAGQSAIVVQPPVPPVPLLDEVVAPPVPLLDEVVAPPVPLLDEVGAPPLPVPPMPPAPPSSPDPGTLLRSTVAMISQPPSEAASVDALKRRMTGRGLLEFTRRSFCAVTRR
jgi:hypothetical protein